MYWDPAEAIVASASLEVASPIAAGQLLGPPERHLHGRWADRAGSDRRDERDNAAGLDDDVHYLSHGLEADLDANVSWLDKRG